MSKSLISVQNVSKTYTAKNFKGEVYHTKALQQVNLEILKGETLGLVGESGSGKSTLGKIILGFEQSDSGEIVLSNDTNTSKLQVIFQDPYSALNPKMSALEIVREALWNEPKEEATKKAINMLALVGITGEDVHKLPRHFSGGQRQRIGIARAVVSKPDFILCDEPTSALDVSIQTQILELLQSLKKELDLSYLFISHDLSVVKHICDRIAVMYKGQIVEIAPTQELFHNPVHEYTKKLLYAELPLNPTLAREKLKSTPVGSNIKIFEKNEWQEVTPNHYVLV